MIVLVEVRGAPTELLRSERKGKEKTEMGTSAREKYLLNVDNECSQPIVYGGNEIKWGSTVSVTIVTARAHPHLTSLMKIETPK